MQNAFTGPVSVNPLGAYAWSFGNMPNGTAYVDPSSGFDMRPQLKAQFMPQLKATLSTSFGAGTAGTAMIPVYLDTDLVDTSRKYTPLVEMVRRVSNLGTVAAYNRITAKAAAVTAAEDAALNDVEDTQSRSSTDIKYIYSVGRVTGQAIVAYPPYMLPQFVPSGTSGFSNENARDALQLEIIKRTRAMKEKEEDLIVNGNASSDSTQFSGFVTLQSTTNKVDKNTSALAYDDIEVAISEARIDSGRPSLAVCDEKTLADLRKILIQTFRYSPSDLKGTLPFGASANLILETSLGAVPVLGSQFLSTTSGSKSMYFLDMDYVEMRVLQDMTYEKLAKTNDSEKFYLKIYEALIMKNTSFNAWIGEIA